MIAKTRVLVGWANLTGNYHTYNTLSPESIIIDNETLEKINMLLALDDKMNIYWIDV